ncbi:MAG: hypothetical protein E6Q97_01445 [Desulfurellales bacterium]|nr:MAG: hypothetical protein E6Q97_01445 [Desulfurellales bacterium]
MKAGLRRVVKTTRGKKGVVRRAYWVRQQAAKPTKQYYGNTAKEGAVAGLLHGLVGVHRIQNTALRRTATGVTLWGTAVRASIGNYMQHGRDKTQRGKTWRPPTEAQQRKHFAAGAASFAAGHVIGRTIHEGVRSYLKNRHG